ncbi:MAG: clan AA aspartic protease [Acidobacteria bacterium]|nr:clan AA aspartic protease [Acidobacteriota bacterium]MBI3424492.1 clan AA aspartic protease [Acidobacteriota bacterium]
MGEVVVQLHLENAVDRELARRGLIKEEEVRELETPAIADSGARMLLLPQEQVEALGLREMRKAIVKYADERKEERLVAGIVTVTVNNRQANVECVIRPLACEALLGQVPLEVMDLLVDCAEQKLVPRPESPILPLLKFY